MRCLAVLSIFIVVHLVAAAIDDENSSNEILHKDPSEEREANFDDYTSIFPEDDFDEVLIFIEDNEYEEIKFRSINKYIQLSEESNGGDESNSHLSNIDAFERNENDSSPKSSNSESKKRKKREASCTNTYPSTFNCDAESKYRTIDGSCNNLKYPEWGMAMGCQERLLPANYKGKAGLRTSVLGGPLTPPRTLSLNINTNVSHPELKLNHLSVFFGQFIAHDIILTPMFARATGEILPCCQPELQNDPRCANIYMKKNDPFYGQFNRTCMDLPRSVTCSSCDNNGRLLMNMNTAFIDGSLIYGSSENISISLRTNDGTGRLISQMTSQGELLPNSSNPEHDQCSFPDKDLICFKGGDARVNQHLLITCLQTIFMKLHNKIASELKNVNPSWDDDTLFSETRRIVGAMIQVIVYKEYLPIVLSPKRILDYELSLSDGFTTYDDSINPSIWIEFSTAAFRVPHSSINTVVSTKPRAVTEGYEWFRDLYSLPFGLRKGPFGELIEDTTRTPAQMVDRFYVTDTNDYMYRIPGDPGGLDMSSIDYQRGRDNGLPTYVQMVKYCHNIKISYFKELYMFMRPSDANLLENNYDSVQDVDLLTALQMEYKEIHSIFGPTSACVVAHQFHHLKFGDRFWFQNRDQPGSFTEAQLKEFKKITLAKTICWSEEGISNLPENAMLFEFPLLNRKINCNEIDNLMDFSQWKDRSE